MRLPILTGALLSALLGASPAAAETCMCAGPPDAVEAMEAREAMDAAGAPHAEGVLEAADADQGEDALSRPLEDISSFAFDPAPLPERVPWCDGDEDPRCAPGQSESQGPRLSSPPPATFAGRADDEATPRAPRVLRHPHVGEGPATGVRRSLERPPRG